MVEVSTFTTQGTTTCFGSWQ